MDKYAGIKPVGEGAGGTVWLAVNKQSNEMVAVKKMKKQFSYSLEQCLCLPEVNVLRNLEHPNIIKLKEVVKENDVLYLVFEYMECNLYEFVEKRGKPFSEDEVRIYCFQIFQALAYMHQRGYFHRDIKPENILVKKDALKIADFGSARELYSGPPFAPHVGTLWYRAPEIILHAPVYDASVDMWSMGATLFELLTHCPLFPGSSAADQIYQMCTVLGRPDYVSWAQGLQLAESLDFQFPQVDANLSISMQIPTASSDAVNLISSLCSWDPRKRPTAAEVLQHSFFQPCFCIPLPLRLRLKALTKRVSAVGVIGDSKSTTAARRPLGDISNASVVKEFSLFANPLGMPRKQPDVNQAMGDSKSRTPTRRPLGGLSNAPVVKEYRLFSNPDATRHALGDLSNTKEANNDSGSIHPVVVAAHPSEPKKIALGMSDGADYVLELSDTDPKWGTVSPQETGTHP